jgi:hypothetical protein
MLLKDFAEEFCRKMEIIQDGSSGEIQGKRELVK